MDRKCVCDAVIFDLDGVLVDSNPLAERHWGKWAARHGISLERILAVHHGRPTVEIMREFAPELPDLAAQARLKEDAEADDTDGLAAFHGARGLLTAIPRDRWAIVTSGTRRTATIRLNYVGLPIPDVFITANDVVHGKPDPEPYQKALARLGFPPARCVVIEDAPAGIASARAAGTRVVAVSSTNPRAALSAADAVVGSLDALTVLVRPTGLELGWSMDKLPSGSET